MWINQRKPFYVRAKLLATSGHFYQLSEPSIVTQIPSVPLICLLVSSLVLVLLYRYLSIRLYQIQGLFINGMQSNKRALHITSSKCSSVCFTNWFHYGHNNITIDSPSASKSVSLARRTSSYTNTHELRLSGTAPLPGPECSPDFNFNQGH